MPHLPLPPLETIQVFGLPLDLIVHAFFGLCISLFFIASGMRAWLSLFIVFSFSVLKEAFDWNAEFARGDVLDPIFDTAATMIGAICGVFLRPKRRGRIGAGPRPSPTTQPPLIVTDKSSLPRARKIFSILRRAERSSRCSRFGYERM